MEEEGFGSCRNYAECEAQCPKEISIQFISRMNSDYLRATLLSPVNPRGKTDSNQKGAVTPLDRIMRLLHMFC